MELVVFIVIVLFVIGLVQAAFDWFCNWTESSMTPEQRAAREARRERWRLERERERELEMQREHQKKLYEMQIQAQKQAESHHFKHKLAEGAVHLAIHAFLGKHGRR